MGKDQGAPTASDGLSSFGSSPQAVSPAGAASIPSADWIEWAGGECPVDDRQKVSVRYRNDTVIDACPAWMFGAVSNSVRDHWQHFGTDADIVAYRIEGLSR